MAVTASADIFNEVFGRKRARCRTITFDSSYPTGGEPVTAALFGLSSIDTLLIEQPLTGYVLAWDKANAKIMAFYGDNNNASDGPLIEVANTTNLSTVTARVTAIGR